MINVALVGTWHVHFGGYADEIAADNRCRITVLWDDNEEKGRAAAEKYGCDFTSDYDAMLQRPDVDAVMVCSSTDRHKEIISKAAAAGKHIFTEKVLCFTEKDALEVADTVKKSGVKFCISFPWRARSDFQWIKKAVDEDLLGRLNYCRMRNAHNGAGAGWLPQTFYDAKTCGGGAMMDLGAHSTYLFNWLLGEPVAARSTFTHVLVDSVEDNAVTVYEYANGAIGVSETSFVANNNPFSFELVGEKGTILAGGFVDRVCYNVGDGWVFPHLPKAQPSPMKEWLDAITDGGGITYGIDDAVALSKTMELAYLSARR